MDSKNLDREIQAGYNDFINFQLNIAERWLERGDRIEDIFAKFFFYFAGFNAIYFLWRKIDRLDQNNEGKHIENLLKKFDELKAKEILDKVNTSIDYFCQRHPIQRMDKRNVKTPSTGDKDEGCKLKEKLQNSRSASERLIALGGILYLVRSNLVHGSKAGSGDDQEIIKMSIEPMRVFLMEALSWTKEKGNYL